MLGMQFGVVTLGTLLRQAKLKFLQTVCKMQVLLNEKLFFCASLQQLEKRVSYVRLRKRTKSGKKINLKYSWHIEDLKAISAHA